MKKRLLAAKLMLLFQVAIVFGQNDTIPNVDTTKSLPFFIHPSKKMSDDELKHKKEGYFITGLPELEQNPINGLGVGANIYLFNNQKKDNPFFPYTPYRERYTAFFKAFESGKWQGALNMDFPYIFNSKWRLRVDAVFENDPNFQYFGFGANTMQPLRFLDKRQGVVRNFDKFIDYFRNLAVIREGRPSLGEANLVTDRHYNEIDYSEQLINILAEKTFAGGRGRLMLGYELLFTQVRDYFNRTAEEAFDLNGKPVANVINGKTRLTEDFLGVTLGNPWGRRNIAGFEGGREGIIAFAIMYDTRDFEPDPTKGVFLEYSHEHSHKWTGSEFSFDKNLIQAIGYQKLFPGKIQRMVLAAHASLGYIWGSRVPFYEAMDISSQAEAGGTEVLGGFRSLRGFREYRFVGPVTGLINIELRTRVAQAKLFKQHFTWDVLPFFDAGRVWDRLGDLSLQNFQSSYGAGIRMAWNQSTILRADWGRSREGTQFFFGFSHIF